MIQFDFGIAQSLIKIPCLVTTSNHAFTVNEVNTKAKSLPLRFM